MLTVKSRESAKTPAGKTQADKISGRARPKAETEIRAQVNPLWHRLATRVQAKLTVGSAHDPCELEADRLADQTVRMGDRHAIAQRSTCAEVTDEGPRRKESGSASHSPVAIPPVVHQALTTTGQPLDSDSRSFFGARFGYDFSQVQIHDDNEGHRAAAALDSLAFTVGRHIAFSSDKYAPHTAEGRRLLAHELVHVVQQSRSAAPGPQSDSSLVDDGAERDIDVLAAAEDTRVLPVEDTPSATIRLAPKPDKPKAPAKPKVTLTVDNVDELYGPLTEDIANKVLNAYGSPLVGNEKTLITDFVAEGVSAWMGLAIIKEESSFANRDNNPSIDERNVANPFSVHFNTNLKRWPKGCGKNLLLIEESGKDYTPGENVSKDCAVKGFRLPTFEESAKASAKTMAKLAKTKKGIDAYREEGGYKGVLNGHLRNMVSKIKLEPK